MAKLASFWVGDSLGPIEIASLRSFLRHGDSVILYTVGPVAGVPEGVELCDAAQIMPCDRILRHRKSGSPALHSDLFRYALMAQTDQIWVDLDVIALRSFDAAGPWLMGYETGEQVNNAILRLPRDSATLQHLLAMRPDTVGLPPTLTGTRRLRYWLKSLLAPMTIDRWPWGATGPKALTHYLRLTGEISHALPQSAFYAIPLQDAGRFLDPRGLGPDDLPPEAWAVHLWGKELRQILDRDWAGQVPAGSFLNSVLREEM